MYVWAGEGQHSRPPHSVACIKTKETNTYLAIIFPQESTNGSEKQGADKCIVIRFPMEGCQD